MVSSCPVPGPGQFRSGEVLAWFVKDERGGRGCGLWIVWFSYERHMAGAWGELFAIPRN